VNVGCLKTNFEPHGDGFDSCFFATMTMGGYRGLGPVEEVWTKTGNSTHEGKWDSKGKFSFRPGHV